jgi:hypothetical protein
VAARRLRSAGLFGALVSVVAVVAPACSASRSAPLDPRYVAVHNAFAAMGMSEIGPIQTGSLAEGRDARFEIAAPAGCVTVGAFGTGGVKDLDVEVFDAESRSLGRDAADGPDAVVRACPRAGGPVTVVVRMTRGAGDFALASWAGGGLPGTPGTPPGTAAAMTAAGTCEAPIPLVAGSVTGNTRHGEAELTGGCGNTEARELVYRLEVPAKQRVTVEVEPSNFDSVVYVRKDDCSSKDAEVACNDDAALGSKRSSSNRGSRIDEIFDPGTYWVVVDGYNNESGSFRMNVQTADVPSLADACSKATPVVQHASGTLTGAFNHAAGSCDHGAGPDVIHRLDVPARARVRAVVHSDEFSPVIHVRRTCTDAQTEIGCTDTGAKSEEAAFVGTLDRGGYTIFADSADKGARGHYLLDVDLAPEQGSGVRGDACGDAIPIGLDGPAIEGDTFAARDDLGGRCTAPGAPDTVYRFDVQRRARVTVRLGREEGDHVFVLYRNCTDKSSEMACGSVIDAVLAPGTYWLAVDGTSKGPFGRYSFQLRAREVGLQEAACKSAPTISVGQTVTGTTDGAPNRFAESCAGNEDAQASGDRVYKLTVPARTRVQALLSTPNHDGVLAIRRACVDPPQMGTLKAVEAGCNNDGPDTRHSKLDVTLDAGTYWVVVDGHQGKHEGAFTLELKEVRSR